MDKHDPPTRPSALVPPKPTDLSGDEPLLPGATVRDFWAWAMGDLRLNSTRGMLAQFLVARAVVDTRRHDDGWGNFDVLTPEGIRVEVKSSGYLQSWEQGRASAIRFGGLTGHPWSAATGYGAEREIRADVFVFCVQTATTPETYDPLDLAQWAFHVVPGETIRQTGQRSIGLGTVRRLAGVPRAWSDLRSAVLAAAGRESREDT
jgi:hypothetical protein